MASDQSTTGKVMRESYADQVYRYLKELILSGQLQQGEKIVEDKISKHFGVSRTPTREALRRLQAYGLVHLQPRSHAEVVRIGEKEAYDIAQLRLHLEKMAFRLLCKERSSEKLETLREIAVEAQNALEGRDKAAYFEADSKFHQTAANLSGNVQLGIMFRQFDSKAQLLRIAQHVSIDRLEVYMRQHFDLLDLVEKEHIGAIDELLRVHIIHDLTHFGDGVV